MKNTVMPAPTPPTSHQKRFPSRPHVRPFESEAAFVSVNLRSLFMVAGRAPRSAWLEVANAYSAVRVEAEDFVKGENGVRPPGNNRTADYGHLALIHVTTTNRKDAVTDCRNTADKAKHQDNREAI